MSTSTLSAPVNRTVLRLSLRSLFGRKRGLLLYALPVLLVALGVLVRVLTGPDPTSAVQLAVAFGYGAVIPLVALISATGVLAPEIEDGSIVYLLAKPVSRYSVVLSKVLVAVSTTVVLTTPAVFLAALVVAGREPRLALALAVGAVAAGAAYCAVFVFFAVLTKHSVVWGLVYWLIWERLLGGLLSGVRWVSITRWGQALADSLAGGVNVYDRLSPTYAVVATLVALVAATALAGWKLRGFSLSGDD